MPSLTRRRVVWKCYLIWLFTGVFGGHYFYCLQYEAGFIYLLTLGIFLFGWLGDLFIIPLLVFQANMIVDQRNQRVVREGIGANIKDNPGLRIQTVRQVRPTPDDGDTEFAR
ncbi:TM2 domain-containing protein [Spironucleus salmonicida]|uniref:Transmembrane domain-containing protein n=1 Tax=Spironucleus salmonicida TaxID=348837 RepID=V6M334_9EUKA|nr:TM2 domain-containing protein [Spironucleus salmonicida]KAH0575455.1 TM2 domain-containing protein [Spironucleus salmonicida]|eukprot:EST41739.1 Transmembrane domain-containing protein [Spironucleus salmonicida]